jgi:hypothetical protein
MLPGAILLAGDIGTEQRGEVREALAKTIGQIVRQETRLPSPESGLGELLPQGEYGLRCYGPTEGGDVNISGVQGLQAAIILYRALENIAPTVQIPSLGELTLQSPELVGALLPYEEHANPIWVRRWVEGRPTTFDELMSSTPMIREKCEAAVKSWGGDHRAVDPYVGPSELMLANKVLYIPGAQYMPPPQPTDEPRHYNL